MVGKRLAMRWFIVVLIGLVLLLLPTGPASANGVPVRVFLSYLPDVSNWGPQNATGEAVVAVGEGWVTIQVQGLPKLQGEVYVAWIVPKVGAAFPVGKFNTDDAGGGSFELRGLSMPREPYRLFLITVEPDLEQYPAPGGRRSIAGRFPDPELLRPATPAPPTATPSPPGLGGGGNTGGAGSGGATEGTEESSPPTTEGTAAQAQPAPTPIPMPAMLPVTGGVIEGEEEVRTWWGLLAGGGLLLLNLLGSSLIRRTGLLRRRRARRPKGGGS